MAMPKFRITPSDQPLTERWISKILPELPGPAAKKYRIYLSSPPDLEMLNVIVEHCLDPAQRSRLHSSIRQDRMRRARRQKKEEVVTITFHGETAAQLNELVDRKPGAKNRISRTEYLERLIYNAWTDAKAHRNWIDQRERREKEIKRREEGE